MTVKIRLILNELRFKSTCGVELKSEGGLWVAARGEVFNRINQIA